MLLPARHARLAIRSHARRRTRVRRRRVTPKERHFAAHVVAVADRPHDLHRGARVTMRMERISQRELNRIIPLGSRGVCEWAHPLDLALFSARRALQKSLDRVVVRGERDGAYPCCPSNPEACLPQTDLCLARCSYLSLTNLVRNEMTLCV